MKITANPGKQNKIHILCDGEYSFTVDAEYWYSSPYCGINNIDDEAELAAFLEAVGSRCAFIAGLRLLSYRDHSEKELINKLVQKGHKKEYAEAAARKLKEYGYINDERYAQSLAETLVERKGLSVAGVRNELFRKGISKEIVNNYIKNSNGNIYALLGAYGYDGKYDNRYIWEDNYIIDTNSCKIIANNFIVNDEFVGYCKVLNNEKY